MRVKLGLTIGLLFVAAPAFAQQITIDYDNDFDFDTTPPNGKGPVRPITVRMATGCGADSESTSWSEPI